MVSFSLVKNLTINNNNKTLTTTIKANATRQLANCTINILNGTPNTEAILKPAKIQDITEEVYFLGATSGANVIDIEIKALDTAAKKYS